MSSSLLQLALGMRELSQTEKRIKAGQIQKIILTSWMNTVVILSENSCHFVNLLSFTVILFSA